jgi:hypothetical protein
VRARVRARAAFRARDHHLLVRRVADVADGENAGDGGGHLVIDLGEGEGGGEGEGEGEAWMARMLGVEATCTPPSS